MAGLLGFIPSLQQVNRAAPGEPFLTHHLSFDSQGHAMWFRRSTTLAIAWLLSFPTLHSFAQEDHWKDLNAKVQRLEQAKKYPEALPFG